MRRAYLFGGVMACTLAALWSCGLDDSAVVAIDGDEDAAKPDASLVDGSSDASIDSPVPNDTGVTDSGVPDTGPCVGTFPTCDTTSCASNQVCTPPIPTGWHVTNLIPNAQSCDVAYGGNTGGSSVVEIGDGGAASCQCNCSSGGNPSCANLHVDVGVGATCTDVNESLDMTSKCAPLAAAIGAGANTKATVSISAGAVCVGNVATTTPIVDAGLSTTCDLNSDAGAICAEHRECVPKPTTGRICIAHSAPTTGVLACPTGFTYSLQTTVASSFSDTRGCNACTCGWNGIGCTDPVVSFYAAAACSGGTTPIPQGACGANGTGLSVGISSGTDNAPSCLQTDGGTPDGGVALVAPETVCCAN